MVSISEIILDEVLADYEDYGYICVCDGDKNTAQYHSEVSE